ncbi:MAG TPA: hypothetical protein DCR43_01835 [Bacteroidales bacterium]|nr:hypothetical protein [Bacteroidales bacterium]HBZ68068.1 hypothetical protein [Bacteroidales bacterium]
MQHFHFLYSCLFLLIINPVMGQELAADLIPDSLTLKANAVIRYSDKTIVAGSESSLKMEVHQAVTILNKNGEDAGLFGLGYNDHSVPSGIVIMLYDANGKLLKKVKSDEVNDYSVNDGMSLYTDSRAKFYKPVVLTYPYTVEISYALAFKGYVGIPGWTPMTDFNRSIEHATFRVKYSDPVKLRYKTLPEGFNPHKEESKNKHSLTWELHSVKAIEPEYYTPSYPEIFPRVFLSCANFEYDGSKGDFSDWNSYGRWIASLLEGRQALPETTVSKVVALTNSLPDDRSKAAALYGYLQDRMRYVSIQYGVGGFQPFPALDVDKWNYGDCKALSNYYVALLKAAGIRCLYAVTVSDESAPGFYEDFPANIYFNHVVAAALINNDTVWVECTNRYYPFGYMGPSTAGNPALVVTPEGGKIVRIPGMSAAESNKIRTLTVDVSDDGSSKMILCDRFTGSQLSTGLNQWIEKPDDQMKNLYEDLDYNGIEIEKLSWDYQRAGKPMVVMTAVVSCKRFASIAGDRLFVPTLTPGSTPKIPDADDKRINPIQLTAAFTDFDTIRINYPSGFLIEQLPDNMSKHSGFGDYELKFKAGSNNITVTRYLKQEKGLFPAESYNAFREFNLAINKAERQKLILKRQQ